MRNMKSNIIRLEKIKTIFHVFGIFVFNYNTDLINKIINRLNTIDSPKTYKNCIFLGFQTEMITLRVTLYFISMNPVHQIGEPCT